MKKYPSIKFMNQITRGEGIPDGDEWYVFDKIDGSNIRAEWSKKKGFYKFGRRHALLDSSNPVLQESPDILKNGMDAKLSAEFKKRGYQRVLCFFEFAGDKSFSGSHAAEPHRLTLIDIDVYRVGLLSPKDFVALVTAADLTEGTDYATVLYSGKVTQQIIDDVMNSNLPGMTFEGAVFKIQDRKHNRRVFKVKTSLWLDKLRDHCGDDEGLFKRLM